ASSSPPALHKVQGFSQSRNNQQRSCGSRCIDGSIVNDRRASPQAVVPTEQVWKKTQTTRKINGNPRIESEMTSTIGVDEALRVPPHHGPLTHGSSFFVRLLRHPLLRSLRLLTKRRMLPCDAARLLYKHGVDHKAQRWHGPSQHVHKPAVTGSG